MAALRVVMQDDCSRWTCVEYTRPMLQHHDGELATVCVARKDSTDGFDVEEHVHDAIIEVVGSESP